MEEEAISKLERLGYPRPWDHTVGGIVGAGVMVHLRSETFGASESLQLSEVAASSSSRPAEFVLKHVKGMSCPF